MAKTVIQLTDSKIIKTKLIVKTVKLSDSCGRYLLIEKNSYKFWRFDYYSPYTKKRNTFGFGAYPKNFFADARPLLAQNIIHVKIGSPSYPLRENSPFRSFYFRRDY